jgi:uncharacterized protein (DUF924 family)
MHAQDILAFWFDELDNRRRFAKDAALDALIGQRFGATLVAATRGELWAWRGTAAGRLAEIIVLDQFSRNIHRDTPLAFAQDAAQRAFAYMPYMHSESLLIHDEAVRLFSQPGLEGTLAFELRHRTIIERFGRYPHRNGILGRASTPEEEAFVQQPGSGF